MAPRPVVSVWAWGSWLQGVPLGCCRRERVRPVSEGGVPAWPGHSCRGPALAIVRQGLPPRSATPLGRPPGLRGLPVRHSALVWPSSPCVFHTGGGRGQGPCGASRPDLPRRTGAHPTLCPGVFRAGLAMDTWLAVALGHWRVRGCSRPAWTGLPLGGGPTRPPHGGAPLPPLGQVLPRRRAVLR